MCGVRWKGTRNSALGGTTRARLDFEWVQTAGMADTRLHNNKRTEEELGTQRKEEETKMKQGAPTISELQGHAVHRRATGEGQWIGER